MTDDYVVDVYPTWTPDGRAVVFSSCAVAASISGGRGSARIGTTTGLEQLTTGAGDDVQASVHPDGRELAFAVRGISSDLWQLPVSPETGRATGLPGPGARHDLVAEFAWTLFRRTAGSWRCRTRTGPAR